MRSRLVSVLAMLGIVSLLSLGTTSCASGSLLIAANTNECVLVPWHGHPIDGTQVRLRQCIGKQQQYWNVANGQITGIGGSCLDVSGAAPVDGARVIYVACNGSPSQHWTVANGQIIGIGGKCLDSLGETDAEGVPLLITACSSSPTQQWQIH
jgi:hypothetical protein